MSEFDPYHKWLGIPPQEQPPHHYRLLGLALFESDPDVIDMAADRQMTYLKQCAAGTHVAHSQKLLSEIAAARLCLLKTESKARYDATLKSNLRVEANRNRRLPIAGGLAAGLILLAGLWFTLRTKNGGAVIVDEEPPVVENAPTSDEFRTPAKVTTEPVANEPASGASKSATGAENGSGQRSVSTPEFEAWVAATSALPAFQQLAEVVKKMQELIPGFDGTMQPGMQDGQVTNLQFHTEHVTDLSPVRGLPALKTLSARARHLILRKGRVSDLTPLTGLPLTSLDLLGNDVTDITPLRGMKLIYLTLTETRVDDFTPLQDMPLDRLYLNGTRVTSLEPLTKMPLRTLEIEQTVVSDLSPLRGKNIENLAIRQTKVADLSILKELPLQSLRLDFDLARDGELLRAIETLSLINYTKAAEFWNKNGGPQGQSQ